MSYKKSNWVPYDPTLSFEQNVTQGGITTADKLNNMETGISNNDINKVTDNHNGTEQLNGVQVLPYNKLLDTIGGRNLLINSASDIVITSTSNNWNYVTLKGDFVAGKVYTISAEITLTGSSNNLVSIWVNGPDISTNIVNTDSFLADGNRHSWTFACPENSTIFGIIIYAGVIGNTAGIGAIVHHVKIEQGSIATDWTPAPEDKVNVSDMRKPASDVAGIEEVNAKQDKIGYTPADDSKVVHSTITQLNSTDMNTVLTAGFYSLNSGTNGMPNADMWTLYQVIPLSSTNGVQVAYGTNNAILGMRSWNRNPGVITFTSWVQFADNSQVAHLSGANNFDTVPTVNNNPVATTDDVATASNTVLTSANTSISKLLQSSSNNDEDSAVTNSTSDTSNFYYWTE